MILEAKGISFGYKKDVNVLNNVSFSAKSGERVGIVAPSGFGKTTLCKILAGYIKPDNGRALLDGLNVYDIKGYHPIQMIWQHPESSVNPRLRLRETIAEGDAVEERIIDSLDIKRDWLNRFPGELSGGELQRFCIARALGRRTRLLIADEISTMLDAITSAQIWSFLLKEIEMRDLGLVVVTHNLALAERICTRIEYIAF